MPYVYNVYIHEVFVHNGHLWFVITVATMQQPQCSGDGLSYAHYTFNPAPRNMYPPFMYPVVRQQPFLSCYQLL